MPGVMVKDGTSRSQTGLKGDSICRRQFPISFGIAVNEVDARTVGYRGRCVLLLSPR